MNPIEFAAGREPRPAASQELLTLTEVAALLGCSRHSVMRLADAGRMPYGVKLGGLRRWRRTELVTWLADNCPPVRVAKGVAR